VRAEKRTPITVADDPPRPQACPMPMPPAVVAGGASTGGTQALKDLLSALDGSFPLPILIAQHMACGFCAGFPEWPLQAAGFPTTIAGSGVRFPDAPTSPPTASRSSAPMAAGRKTALPWDASSAAWRGATARRTWPEGKENYVE